MLATLTSVLGEMHGALARTGVPVPTWRTLHALRSKWLPAAFSDKALAPRGPTPNCAPTPATPAIISLVAAPHGRNSSGAGYAATLGTRALKPASVATTRAPEAGVKPHCTARPFKRAAAAPRLVGCAGSHPVTSSTEPKRVVVGFSPVVGFCPSGSMPAAPVVARSNSSSSSSLGRGSGGMGEGMLVPPKTLSSLRAGQLVKHA